MIKEDLIISMYCIVEEIYKKVTMGKKLRHRGPQPLLTDVEALTILMAGEYFSLGNDKKIWSYF